jgi:hypothetical protein
MATAQTKTHSMNIDSRPSLCSIFSRCSFSSSHLHWHNPPPYHMPLHLAWILVISRIGVYQLLRDCDCSRFTLQVCHVLGSPPMCKSPSSPKSHQFTRPFNSSTPVRSARTCRMRRPGRLYHQAYSNASQHGTKHNPRTLHLLPVGIIRLWVSATYFTSRKMQNCVAQSYIS